MKALLGTGLLGSAMVTRMRRQGQEVKIWNRTISKAEKLAETGAIVCKTIVEAVDNADEIHLVLKDDAVVNEVLDLALAGLKPGAIIVDHTTTSVDGAKERTAIWKAKGFVYQHAPVLMGPDKALAGKGKILISGDQKVIQKLLPGLAKMTGEVVNLGMEVGKAAGLKLISNLFLLSLNAGISDVLTLGKSTGFTADELGQIFIANDTNAMVKRYFGKLLARQFQKPSWELSMARKDAQLMINQAGKTGEKLITTPALAEVMDRWIEKGHGLEDWTVFMSDKV